jgi:hypothetical protein
MVYSKGKAMRSNPEQEIRMRQERAREYKKAMEGVNNAVAVYSRYYAAFLAGVYEKDPDIVITPELKAILIETFQQILIKANPLVKIASWDTETDVMILELGRFKLKCYIKDLNDNEQEAVCELEL